MRTRKPESGSVTTPSH
ncbi:hypothetical protein RSOL_183250 [Rhizoctonia solani AG-3 Rhs1AP]|uniref:Uncharacterized protein n=1 Tax=Rhizoctonia solani AG-3 Rhs1AP TaxID=1086054 RepID=X8J2E5_9AGAM|nr:hypothetical protein RSOL_183250 [Rhizoctonia solani AG-3 Rhs1AP]